MLRPLHQISNPDPRHAFFVVVDELTGQTTPATLARHHADVAELTLLTSVPAKIADEFDLARQAFLYSWFIYEFGMLASQQAYAASEMALRERTIMEGRKPEKGLAGYLKLAASEGWICDSGFGVAANRPPILRRYVDVLPETMPKLRNGLAHGDPHLAMPQQVLMTLEICRDLINQLFPEQGAGDSTVRQAAAS